MENSRFDELTRMIASFTSRRAMLRGAAAGGSLLGLGAAGIVPGFGENAEAKKNKNKKKKRKEKKRQKKCKKNCSSSDPCESASCNNKGKCKKKSSDNAGQTCDANEECCSAVCNCADPSGWITQPDAGACQQSNYTQDFEKNLDFWFNFQNDPPSSGNATFPTSDDVIERVPSGEDGIDASSGGFYAQVKTADAYAGDLTALSTLGGFSNVFPNAGIKTTIDIYLDPVGTLDDQFFAYTVALNQTDCNHIQDFAFLVGRKGEDYCVGTASGAGSNANPCAGGVEPITSISNSGWYTFQHVFTESQGGVSCTLSLLDSDGQSLNDWEKAVNQPGPVGGNRYAWFPVNKLPFVAIDNSTRNS